MRSDIAHLYQYPSEGKRDWVPGSGTARIRSRAIELSEQHRASHTLPSQAEIGEQRPQPDMPEDHEPVLGHLYSTQKVRRMDALGVAE